MKPEVSTPVVEHDPHLERAHRVLSEAPLIDGHNDLPWAIRVWSGGPEGVLDYDLRTRTPGHTDLERLALGRVGGQLWSLYVPCHLTGAEAVRTQFEQIALAKALIGAYPEALEEAHTAADARRIFRAGRIASYLAIEGGQVIDGSLDTLRRYHAAGVRFMTLTHNCTHDWADAAQDVPLHGGLTPFGLEVVREMNRLGMMVDLSHTSDEAARQAMDTSIAPVLWTHACARALVPHRRNVPDELLRRLAENGGVVMATFVPAFVDERHREWDRLETELRREMEARHGRGDPRIAETLATWRASHPIPPATLSQVADHVEHLQRVAGADHVGIGSDFDGITRVVQDLEDVSTYPALLAELSRRGWSDPELAKLAGENLLRAMAGAEDAARRLRREAATG
jgi:membrane dipeptidase